MLDEFTRPLKESLLTPVARALPIMHPNWVTAAAFLFGLIAVIFAFYHYSGWAALFWGLNRFADGLDGTMARHNKRESGLGGYFDILADFTLYVSLPFALVWGRPTIYAWVALSFLLTSYYLNAASFLYLELVIERRARGIIENGRDASLTLPAGLIGGTETILFYFVFIFLPHYLAPLFVCFALLVFLTIVQRLVWAVKSL